MPDENPELTKALADLAAANTELSSARSRIAELNKESQGHRLNADNFRNQVDTLKTENAALTTKVTEANTAHTAAIEALRNEHTTTVTALKTEHTAAIEGVKTEFTAKLTESETAREGATKTARETKTSADLRVAAMKAGMVDLDGLKLVDSAAIKVDDMGSVTNGEEVMATLKGAKPFLFGTGSTSTTTTTPPPPKPGDGQKSAMAMTPEEYTAAKSALVGAGHTPSTFYSTQTAPQTKAA